MTIETLTWICYVWIAIAVIVFVTMFFITAPFGRHTSEKWGIMINNKLGWIIIEFPSLELMSYFLYFCSRSFSSFVWILFAVWIMHYVNRTMIYPFRIKPTPKKM